MEKLSIAKAQLKAAIENVDRDRNALMVKLDGKEEELKERLNELNKRFDPDRANLDASDDDFMEINAGGKIIAAKRSVLTQLKGTRLEALFSGRWEKELQRDDRGRIFLDANSLCFQAIVDYLNELAISSEDNPPDLPTVDNEHKAILQQYLKLFGMLVPKMPDSNIIKIAKDANRLHGWLEEDGSDGDFCLIYRSSRDGLDAGSFHSKCDNQGPTLTIIETTDGDVLGGYSNTPWASNKKCCTSNKAFLFVLSGSDVSFPLKMRLKNADDSNAVYHNASYGPTFGSGHDLGVQVGISNGHSQLKLHLYMGSSYEPGPSGKLARIDGDGYRIFTIKDMEVFEVSSEYSPAKIGAAQAEIQGEVSALKPVTRFSEDVNQAINARQESLLQAEAEILRLEESYDDEKKFIAAFATGETKDVILLNVSGTVMAAKRSTLQAAEGSVLAQQFDDAKWTEQGCNLLRVKEWTTSDVVCWANNIHGIQENVSKIFEEHSVNGPELVSLNTEGLKMLGVNRPGTLCLLLNEIGMLKKGTLIQHGPYCFGKILDYLRLKQLHSECLLEEQVCPQVCDSQKGRFEKVVQYYFPGDSVKLILG